MKVVISQPMFFPWIGMFEQIRLAETYVHYSDVQFSKGSFVNRVQIKTSSGIKWLTVPLKGLSLGQHIESVEVNDSSDWRNHHLRQLGQAYAEAPFLNEMVEVAREVYSQKATTIEEIAKSSLNAVLRYFEFSEKAAFLDSKDLNIDGASSRRVLDIVLKIGGKTYVTGHGAKKYLDHELFETNGVRVEYMDYLKSPYPQLHGEFTPFVSILDLIANVGRDGKRFIHSGTKYWKDCV